jgi:hypothetical protein
MELTLIGRLIFRYFDHNTSHENSLPYNKTVRLRDLTPCCLRRYERANKIRVLRTDIDMKCISMT